MTRAHLPATMSTSDHLIVGQQAPIDDEMEAALHTDIDALITRLRTTAQAAHEGRLAAIRKSRVREMARVLEEMGENPDVECAGAQADRNIEEMVLQEEQGYAQLLKEIEAKSRSLHDALIRTRRSA